MVELLVTLVLLGLIASVTAPRMESWLSSSQASAVRTALSSELALLPLQANRQGQSIVLSDISQMQTQELNLEFIQPVVVLANGYCLGGIVALQQNTRRIVFEVLAPFCRIRRNNDA
jgi:general secretion pathway protein G